MGESSGQCVSNTTESGSSLAIVVLFGYNALSVLYF